MTSALGEYAETLHALSQAVSSVYSVQIERLSSKPPTEGVTVFALLFIALLCAPLGAQEPAGYTPEASHLVRLWSAFGPANRYTSTTAKPSTCGTELKFALTAKWCMTTTASIPLPATPTP